MQPLNKILIQIVRTVANANEHMVCLNRVKKICNVGRGRIEYHLHRDEVDDKAGGAENERC